MAEFGNFYMPDGTVNPAVSQYLQTEDAKVRALGGGGGTVKQLKNGWVQYGETGKGYVSYISPTTTRKDGVQERAVIRGDVAGNAWQVVTRQNANGVWEKVTENPRGLHGRGGGGEAAKKGLTKQQKLKLDEKGLR
jgi:hypothetical protein